MKETPLLLPAQRRVDGVDIENDLLGRLGVRFHKHVHQQAVHRCAVTADLLVAVHAAGRTLQPVQRRLAGQRLVVIVEVFLPQRQRVDPLRDQLPDLVFDQLGIAPVFEAGGQARQQVDAPVDLAQQQRAAVGADHPAVKLGAYLAAKVLGKREARLAYTL